MTPHSIPTCSKPSNSNNTGHLPPIKQSHQYNKPCLTIISEFRFTSKYLSDFEENNTGPTYHDEQDSQLKFDHEFHNLPRATEGK